jgi:predicted nucleotidyltransferase
MDNKLKILNYLGKHPGESFTMNGLSKVTGIPYATFYRTVQDMKDLITINAIGKSKTIVLKSDNPEIKSYLSISSAEEKKEFLKTQPVISKIASELNSKDIVLLFGSYAKGGQKASSDIDILIINRKGEKSISFSKYEILFRKRINPIFVTKVELEQMLRDKEENVGKQALKDHIVLNNPEGFWEAVLHG